MATDVATLSHRESLRRRQTILCSLINALTRHGPALLIHLMARSHDHRKILTALMIQTVAHSLCWHVAHSLAINDISTHGVKTALQPLILVLIQGLRMA